MFVYSQTDYCETSSPERTDESWITAFSIEGTTEPIDLEWTDFPENGYVFDENLIVEHYAGGTLYYEIKTEVPGYTLTAYADTDNNYVFDSYEMIFTTNNGLKHMGGEFTIIPNLPNGDYRVRIRLGYNLYNPIPPCGFHNFGSTLDFTLRIIDTPSCIPNYDLKIDYATANEAQISWTSPGNSTDWVIEFGEPGDINEILTNTNPFILTNLNPETEYEVRVQTQCGADSSGWTNTRIFSTTCASQETPYQLDLTNVEINDLPNCYTTEQESKIINWKVISHYTPNNEKTLGILEEYAIDSENWLYTPSIQLEAGEEYILSFDTAAYSTVLTKGDNATSHIFQQDLLEITLGKKPFNEAMNSILQEATLVRSEEFVTTEIIFEATETAEHFIGFHTIDFFNSLFLKNIKIDKSMSISDFSKNSKVSIYPNPALDRVYIHADSEIKQVSLFNVAGQKIKSIQINQQLVQLDVSDIPSGSYFLLINTKDGKQSLQLLKE